MSERIVVLDIGSNKIAGIVVEGNAVVASCVTQSTGLKTGTIINHKGLETSILRAVYELEKISAGNIRSVHIVFSCVYTRSHYTNHSSIIEGKTVTKQDVIEVINRSIKFFRNNYEEVVHYFPLEFSVDNQNSIVDPLGVYGKDLGCRMHIVSCTSPLVQEMVHCVTGCQISVESVMIATYTAGLACLTNDEKILGSLVIDFGGTTTSFGVFVEGKLVYISSIAIGSNHITSDIAKVFSLSLFQAEKVKILHGRVDLGTNEPMGEILIENPSPNEDPSVQAKDLMAVITARAVEICEMVFTEYSRLDIDHLVTQRIVITGGGSGLGGLAEHVSNIFQKNVRIGKPISIENFKDDVSTSLYLSAIGALNHIRMQNQAVYDESQISEPEGLLKRLFKWFTN